MASISSGKWAILEHSATHGWNNQLAWFLKMPAVVEYCGVIHCGAFVSLTVIYGALDSIPFIALCSYENSSSPPHSILGNNIPVHNIDGKFDHMHFTLVLEATLRLSNVTCALTVPHINIIIIIHLLLHLITTTTIHIFSLSLPSLLPYDDCIRREAQYMD